MSFAFPGAGSRSSAGNFSANNARATARKQASPRCAHPEALAAAPRLLLHARDLSFQHPETGDWLRAHSPAPFRLSGLTGARPG